MMSRVRELLIGFLIAAVVFYLTSMYVYVVGFGIQCNGRTAPESPTFMIYECWFDRRK